MKKIPSLQVTQNNESFNVILQGTWVKESIQKLEPALSALT